MTERGAKLLLGSLLLAAVFALALVKIEDYDAFTHLALGRDIVQHRGFPATEQLNFPSFEMPYHNPAWLFGLVVYLAYLAGGSAGVILLKASIVTLAFFILFKDSLIPQDPPSHRVLEVVVASAVLFPILLMVRHRFVERPDIALMVFLSFTIYALDAYVYEGRRYLYFLPLLQVVWVNMHPSVVVGAVPFVAFLVGGGLQRLVETRFGVGLPGTPSRQQLKTIAVVFGGVALASLLNPYGINAILAPFRLAASPWFMHEVDELQVPNIGDLDGAPYIVAVLLVLVFVVTVRRLSLVSVLLVGPFVYLGLSARRFIFLLAIVSAPLLARQVRSLARRLSAGWVQRMGLSAAVIAASLVVTFTGLSLARIAEPFGEGNKIPGFGVDYESFPEGALGYLDRVGVTGRVFNTFHWGGYIVWRDYPRRIPIVDGRGYVPPGLLDEIMAARLNPARLERLQATYGFDVMVVHYPEGVRAYKGEVPQYDLSLAHRDWALVYWDDVALAYLKRTEPFAKIIERDEYRHVKPANGFAYLKRKLGDRNLLVEIEAELHRNIAVTQSSLGYALLGYVYNEVGSYEKAIEMLSRLRDLPSASQLHRAYRGLGFAYDQLGDMERAIADYKKAARLDEDPTILVSIGTAFEKIGNDREAIRYLERALDKDRRLVRAYPPLLRAYRRLGRMDRVQTLEAAYQESHAHGEAEKFFRIGVKLYLEKRHHEAISAFLASLRINPGNPAALSNLGYVYYDLGMLDKASAVQKQAVEAAPNFAGAHYGLGIIYRDRDEYGLARAHFEEYLRLEPRGYWSRKAQEALKHLPTTDDSS